MRWLAATLLAGGVCSLTGCFTQMAWRGLARPEIRDIDRIVGCSGRTRGARVELALTISDGKREHSRAIALEQEYGDFDPREECRVRCVVAHEDERGERAIAAAPGARGNAPCEREVKLSIVGRKLGLAQVERPRGGALDYRLIPARSRGGVVAFSFLSPFTAIADLVTLPFQAVLVLIAIARH